ncbi:hypothetical protein WICPIJ_008595 [Wickerhamomyces pijperi]|uniref:Ribosome quality control complex subunit 1 n=1 Tax=Wickerhamomyces pijperi TaxID=599730 RepID=A0A9P8TI57_WICPI|nr:hypothetical protein WICPIJ_008595 [Wickerhamomyces pijperi]
MSSRALRRLEREREKALESSGNSPAALESEEESYHAPPTSTNKAKNLFALMVDSEEEEAPEDDSEEEQVSKPIEKASLPTKSQKKKNKNKKAKGKKAKKQELSDEEDEDDEVKATVSEDEEFERLLKELKGEDATKGAASGATTSQTIDLTEQEEQEQLPPQHPIDPSYRHFTIRNQLQCQDLLRLNPRELDPDTEFQKLFGKLSSEALEDANSTTSTSIPPEQLAQIKKLSKIIRGWGGRDRRSIPGTSRKLILTKVRDDWIPTQKSDITMDELTAAELIDNKLQETDDWMDVIKDDISVALRNGIRQFKFTRSSLDPQSKMANSQFFHSVITSPNHENLISLLQRSPYHPETILQVALIFIRQGDKSNSNGLIERALFVFDRAFKTNMELCNGLTRLPFNYYLNRQFYLTLFRYIDVLTKKGTYGTALAYCKLLLSLDPQGDPFGVRYFLDFYALIAGQYQYLIDLVKSPLVQVYKKWYTPGLAYSCALAYLKLGKLEEARCELKNAFLRHPYVGYKLLEAIGLASDIPVGDYKVFEVGPEIELECEAYVMRAGLIWNEASDRKFLHDTLLQIINSGSKGLKFDQLEDPVIPLNLLRFVILSGEGKLMSKIPASIWDENEIYEFDVLPPTTKNTELLNDFIDSRFMNEQIDEQRLLEMVQNMSLQDYIDENVQ